MNDCPDCACLSEEYWSLHAEVVAARDELTLTHKNDLGNQAKKTEMQRLEGAKKDAGHRLSVHREQHRHEP
jgi:hypothetical protein